MIDVKLDGLDTLLERIDTIVERASDLSAVWPAVGHWYGTRATAVFVKGRAVFAPLKTSYFMRKRKRGLLGQGTGVLFGSLRDAATEPTPDVAAPTYALFGLTRSDPKRLQERGGFLKKGRPSMRSRNVVPALTPGERRHVAELIRDQILKE